MPKIEELEQAMPVAPLKLIALSGATSLGESINQHLVSYRKTINNSFKNDPAFQGYVSDNYLLHAECPRFGSGEAKGVLYESVRGTDLYILVDVTNYSVTYPIGHFENHMSPDDHYQDLKRIIAACNGKAHRINVIMPFLYEGRQHKRSGRESLDCAYALRELSDMGISNFITFDAHDPRVQNSTPLCGFDNFSPNYQITKILLRQIHDLNIDKDNTIVISPDEGALDRAVYFSTVLGVNTGMFYKRRDYSVVVNGKNPIVAHEFLGEKIDSMDVIIIDDMISSGESMLDTSRQLKEMNARRVFLCVTFGLFTNGMEAFDKAYENGYFDYVVTTNLTYLPPEVTKRSYVLVADLSQFMASIIDFSNHDISFAKVLTPTEKINKLVSDYNARILDEI
ncbi:MAG: ribose-phosphate pyrophosphokinase [Lachnospiraceae bacterium]|nr:ribose-phosphate pyrophosphokinase [Lachnospiraceae bacterium]